MGQHGSARLSVHSRRLIAVRVLDEGWSLTAAAQATGVCRQTATKWLDRFVQEGEAGLRDRTADPIGVVRWSRRGWWRRSVGSALDV
jgi:hypothetical protein